MYSLRPKILAIKMDKRDVSRTKICLDTSPFIHFDDKYFRTEGVIPINISENHTSTGSYFIRLNLTSGTYHPAAAVCVFLSNVSFSNSFDEMCSLKSKQK